MNADQYGTLALQAANAMRLVDPSIELVACGSSGHWMDTFGYWESTVLEHTFDAVDYVSMHAYYEQIGDDRASFLASGAAMDRFIDDVVATVDAVAARKHSRKRLRISFDEWNVWYQARFAGTGNTEIDQSGARIEDVYSTVDAVVVGDLLASLINHSDRIGVGCFAQLVNVIAPIMTEPGGAAWRQAIYYPIAETIRRARGTRSLVTLVDCGELSTQKYGDVPSVAAAACTDPESGAVTVFLTNRADSPVTVELNHQRFGDWAEVRAYTITGDERGPLHGTQADAARPVEQDRPKTADGTTHLTLPAQSWTVLDAR